MRAIYFDMDGTIADLYGQKDWLECLIKEYTKPYREARPIIDMRRLSYEINRLQNLGYVVGIVSWGSKDGTNDFLLRTEKAKMGWLSRHLGSVNWDEIHVVEYGTPKSSVVNFPNGILFDDEERNRKEWDLNDGIAFDVNNILEILEKMF